MVLTVTEKPATPSDAARGQVEDGIRALVAWGAGLGLEDIPVRALRRIAMILGDDLAAISASQDEPEVRRAQDMLLRRKQAAEATVFRAGRPRADRWNGAVANAIAADWAELDEGYRKATCHAGLYTLPALLAEAEASDAPVGEVLRAAIGAYEITTRFARAWKFPALTLHPHAIFNAVGAAAAVGLLRRLSAPELQAAITAATTLVSVGPYDHAVRGALVRNVWASVGAWSGMQAVDWARCGIGGLASSPYDVYSRGLGGEARPDQLLDGLGREWAVEDGYHKVHACCQYAHSAIEATQMILDEAGEVGGGSTVTRVLVETHPLGLTLSNYAPETSLAAKFSMPHAVAATLVFGDAGPLSFAATSLAHPEVARLRAQVELALHPGSRPWPEDRPARVTVELRDGRRFAHECLSAKGGPDRPFADPELLDKMRRLAADTMPGLADSIAVLAASEGSILAQSWPALVTRFYGASA